MNASYTLGWSLLVTARAHARVDEAECIDRLEAFAGTRDDMETVAAIFLRAGMVVDASFVWEACR